MASTVQNTSVAGKTSLFSPTNGSAITVQPDADGGSFVGSSSDGARLAGIVSQVDVSSYSGTMPNKGVRTNLRVLGSPADYNAISQITAQRTVRTATAIRAGLWHEFSGRFTTDPSGANDFSSFFPMGGVDDAANPSYAVPGELSYMYGAIIPASGQYPAK